MLAELVSTVDPLGMADLDEGAEFADRHGLDLIPLDLKSARRRLGLAGLAASATVAATSLFPSISRRPCAGRERTP
jgi:hypothetical protein